VAGAVQVAAGYHDSFALMPNGTVLSWGGDGLYQLGHGWRVSENPPPSESEGRTEARSPKPRPVVGSDWTPSHRTSLEEVTSIADQVALLKDGEVRTWGAYYGGKLGNGTDGEREHAEQGSPVPVSPTLGAGGPDLTGIKAIAAGGDTRLAINQEGKVFGWGLDYSGMLGAAASGVHTVYPVEIQGVGNVVEVALGSNGVTQGQSLFLVKQPNGETEILALGSNKEGQLGNPNVAEQSTTPVPVLNASGEVLRHVIAIAASDEASFALVEPRPDEREVLAWGRNNGGQLGIGSTSPATSVVPLRVIGANGEANFPQPISSLHAGKYYGQVIAAGKLFAWGGNEQGQIGDGTEANKPTPLEVRQWDGTPLPSKVLAVSGTEHAIALLEGAVPAHMMTAVLENRETPQQQIAFTWQTPGEVNLNLRIVATEQVEHWQSTITYKAGERVEDTGTNPKTHKKEQIFYIAKVENTGERPFEHPSVWASEFVNKTAKARRITEPLNPAARSFTLPLPPTGQINNPFYDVIVEEQMGGSGAWNPHKRVNTQWM
jgi:alpha-tubulin suppressor-like RCC1 family protein